MTNTLDDIASNEINWAYTGKNIAQHLQVTVPEAPSEWKQIIRNWAISETIFGCIEKLHSAYLFLFDRKMYKEKIEYMEQEKQRREELHQAREKADTEFEEELRASGITTEQEKDAYMVAHFAGLAMVRFVYRADESKDGVEIVKRKNGVAEEVRVTQGLFEDYLAISVNDGIICLEEKYWINLPDVQKPEIVNPDFEAKAIDWLKGEVYSKTTDGKECKLLERVVVKRVDNGRFNLRTFY